MSFNFIENKHFTQNMGDYYVLPDRKKLSNKLLYNEFELVETVLHQRLNRKNSMTLIADGWTNINETSIVNPFLATPRSICYNSVNAGKNAHKTEYITANVRKKCLQ